MSPVILIIVLSHFFIMDSGPYYHRLFEWLTSLIKSTSAAKRLRDEHGLQGNWLIVTPVYWQATHNDAMIMTCGEALNLSEQQGIDLYNKFSCFVANDGMKTHYHDAFTWLLQTDGKPPIRSVNPYDIVLKSIGPYLKSLDSTLFWQRFITEIQMLFSGSSSHQSKVNGVWVWGEEPQQRLFSFKRAS